MSHRFSILSSKSFPRLSSPSSLFSFELCYSQPLTVLRLLSLLPTVFLRCLVFTPELLLVASFPNQLHVSLIFASASHHWSFISCQTLSFHFIQNFGRDFYLVCSLIFLPSALCALPGDPPFFPSNSHCLVCFPVVLTLVMEFTLPA